MLSINIKKTLESISLEYKRNVDTLEESHIQEMKLVEETERMGLETKDSRSNKKAPESRP